MEDIKFLTNEEKWKHSKAKTGNPLSYICIDEDGKSLDEGIGQTLNISQGGLIMETKFPIEENYILLISLDFKEEIIKGKVVYCIEKDPKIFHTGVCFIKANDRIREMAPE